MLDERLTTEQIKELVGQIFGFSYEQHGDHYVLIDDDGQEFYGYDKNDIHDFFTLRGMFAYMEFCGIEKGEWRAKNEIRKALGL